MSKLLLPVGVPRLPIARSEYDEQSQNEFKRVLDLYFVQLNALTQGLISPGGGKYISSVYGGFSNTTTQSIAAANTPYIVQLNTTDVANGMTLASNRMTVAQDGIYNAHYCLQFENTAASIIEAWVWLRKNGTDIPNSASVWGITSSHGGINGYLLATANFLFSLAANDYLEVVVAADATGLNIEAYTASASPFARPSIPSSVVTLSFVSAPLR
jgi:hypothetical protein